MPYEIQPDQASVSAGESVRFVLRKDGVELPAELWLSGANTELKDGVYEAPAAILIGRKFVVRAKIGGETVANATLETMAAHTWIPLIWAYLVSSVIACALGIWMLWPQDLPPKPVPIVAGPALTTLKQGDSQVFSSSSNVKWNGVEEAKYVAAGGAGTTKQFLPEGDESSEYLRIVVNETAAASLKLTPAYAVLAPGKEVTFSAHLDAPAPAPGDDLTLAWDPPATGNGATGKFKAPTGGKDAQVILVRVHTNNPRYVAEARVLVMPEDGPVIPGLPGWKLLLLAGFAGALGALLHGINSFAAYIGARKFLSSWGIYYLARPLVGALMGNVMFLVFRSNLVGDAQRVDTASLLSVAALAFLSGMFADKASRKLEQLAEVLFGSGADPRPNKLAGGASTDPTIAKLDPDTLNVGAADRTVKVIGTNFATGARVKVNGVERGAAFASSTEVSMDLTSDEVSHPGTFKIQVVVNGKESHDLTLTVKA
ncbi:MAG: hypothetical protein ABI972_17650 [Acidobacteriota bacterium]